MSRVVAEKKEEQAEGKGREHETGEEKDDARKKLMRNPFCGGPLRIGNRRGRSIGRSVVDRLVPGRHEISDRCLGLTGRAVGREETRRSRRRKGEGAVAN